MAQGNGGGLLTTQANITYSDLLGVVEQAKAVSHEHFSSYDDCVLFVAYSEMGIAFGTALHAALDCLNEEGNAAPLARLINVFSDAPRLSDREAEEARCWVEEQRTRRPAFLSEEECLRYALSEGEKDGLSDGKVAHRGSCGQRSSPTCIELRIGCATLSPERNQKQRSDGSLGAGG